MALEILSTSFIYTLLVFTGGFLCGIIRVPIIEPRIGSRYAQLLEMPLMMAVIWRSARLVLTRHKAQSSGSSRYNNQGKGRLIAVGALALLWFLAIEGRLYAWIHQGEDKDWQDWIWDRDPVAGTVFFALLGVFMALPAMLP
ncbi:hypothetical protein B0H67DRAFT_594882 [Lasiosphaeris hirsuta]|uniref:Uncharacterized protein n=1 Tax=Lasiosphaeris hirsuta TaxID=260670 RepID=A0AA40DJ51_9PEZI|nr:hypothetical protein B0H67DRAFT_594882 [Lasiosphaeris hirsuta]